MRYLLDTNVLIDVAHAVEPVRSTVRGWLTAREVVAVCAVQIAEYFAGLRPNDRSSHGTFLHAFAYWDVSRRAALHAGVYRYDLARLGIQLSTPDALIAAVAHEHSAILITRNVRDFPMTDIWIHAI